ncbi:hypothetical protein [Nitratifractor sp.]
MRSLLALCLLLTLSTLQAAENNDSNRSHKQTASKEELIQKRIKEQMEREKQYAKEKTFYEGKEYNTSVHQVDPADLNAVPTIEPEYDFNMDDVYD